MNEDFRNGTSPFSGDHTTQDDRIVDVGKLEFGILAKIEQKDYIRHVPMSKLKNKFPLSKKMDEVFRTCPRQYWYKECSNKDLFFISKLFMS